ncbi:MAG: hypothetical protein P5700_23570, partial [Arthrospira platensis PCC 7345]|nr:hypothetical protein [Limnospira sp. PMC 289.06]MDT9297975.1 hypothetical protein [Arthrospira platensis PCC 7345]MDT9313380.1 hypothetical protein [Limnospira sp. Paracas R14]
GTYKQLWGWSGVRSLYSTEGLKSPPGGYFGYCNPISCLNVSHQIIEYSIEYLMLAQLLKIDTQLTSRRDGSWLWAISAIAKIIDCFQFF